MPLPIEYQIVSIFLGVGGFLDKVEVSKIKILEAFILDFILNQRSTLFNVHVKGLSFELDMDMLAALFDLYFFKNGFARIF
jgi:hypothetical protein